MKSETEYSGKDETFYHDNTKNTKRTMNRSNETIPHVLPRGQQTSLDETEFRTVAAKQYFRVF